MNAVLTYTLGAFFMGNTLTEQPDIHKKIGQWEAMGFVWEVLILIAVPTVFCALLGRWADTYFGIKPWGTALCLLLALGISGVLVTRSAKGMAKRMKSTNPQE